MINFWPPSDIFLRLAEREESDLGGEQDRDMIGGTVVFSDLVCNVNLGGSLWVHWCRSGPSGGQADCQGGLSPSGQRPHLSS